MIHFDKEGNVIGSFAAPQGHGMDVDSKGFAYLGQNTVRKYDTRSGKMVAEIPHAPETENGQKFMMPQLPNHTPGQGGQGPVAGFLPPPPGAPRAAGWRRRQRARPGRAGGGAGGLPREVSADDADDCRRAGGDSR